MKMAVLEVYAVISLASEAYVRLFHVFEAGVFRVFRVFEVGVPNYRVSEADVVPFLFSEVFEDDVRLTTHLLQKGRFDLLNISIVGEK